MSDLAEWRSRLKIPISDDQILAISKRDLRGLVDRIEELEGIEEAAHSYIEYHDALGTFPNLQEFQLLSTLRNRLGLPEEE